MRRTNGENTFLLNASIERNEASNVKYRLIIVLILSIAFLFIGFFGGIWSNSLAIITDAGNTVVDVIGFLISIISIQLAKRKPSNRFSFGFSRAEVLGGLVNILIIWLISGILLRLAWDRVMHQNFRIRSTQMISISIIGLSLDLLMFLILHGDTFIRWIINRFSSKETNSSLMFSNNISVRAVTIHILGDFLQGLGDLLAGILIYINYDYKLADPICTLIFSTIAIAVTFPLLREIFCILMEGVPSHLHLPMIADDLAQLPGVVHVHNLHLWSLSTEKIVLSVHLSISNVDQSEVLKNARNLLEQDYHITETIIQIEQNLSFQSVTMEMIDSP